MTKLVTARPDEADRCAFGRQRDQRGIAGDIVGTVVPVTARTVGVDAADLRDWQTDDVLDRIA